MKLVCMTQVYNQNTRIGFDGKTNIRRFMDSVSQYCDGLVVFDDGSTDGTREVITSYSGDFVVEILGNKENTPDQEGYHRARSLEHCRRMKADWVLTLDPDEVFEKNAERHFAANRHRMDTIQNVCAYTFMRRELWRTDRFIRVDGQWAQWRHPRLFRLTEKLYYDITPGVRSALTPSNLLRPWMHSGFKIIHYGFASDLDIIRRHQRFKSLGVDISELLDDKDLRLAEALPSWFDDSSWPYGPGIEIYDKQIGGLIG